jgi:hypothetical protein
MDRFGRTKSLMAGSAVMAFAMWFIGAYIKIAAPSSTGSGPITPGGYAAVAMIYVYAVGWCFSWAGSKFFNPHISKYNVASIL